MRIRPWRHDVAQEDIIGRVMDVSDNHDVIAVTRRSILVRERGACEREKAQQNGGEPHVDYRPLNSGFRFSTNAFMPSFWSSKANSEWNSRRSNFTPSVSVVS